MTKAATDYRRAQGRGNAQSQTRLSEGLSADWLWLAVTLVAGVVRLVVAASTPLFPDEMYYWDWSRHLAPGYFDHPPMIAWLVWLGTMVAGPTPLGVRLFAVLAGVVAVCFVCLTARRLGGTRAANVAAIVFAVVPMSAAGLVLATPDAPTLAAAAATLYAVVCALQAPERSVESLRWWCAGGLALGLAFCSKITAALLPAGVLVGLLLRRDLRGRLAEPGPYIATCIAMAVFLPMIAWNIQHDWISFRFQIQHGLGGASGSIVRRELDLIGGQLGIVTPILFAMCGVAVVRALRSSQSGPAAVLAAVATLVFCFFFYSATRRRVEPNWPALAYVPAVALLAAYAGTRSWNRWLFAGIVLAGGLTMVSYVNAYVPILPVSAPRDPVARSHGWDELAVAVERVHRPRRSLSSYRTHVAGNRYQEATALAFHLPGHPQTFSLNLASRANQYDLWPSFRESAQPGDALLLVVDDVGGSSPTVETLAPHFSRATRGELVHLTRNGALVKNLRIWVLDGWRGTWPQDEVRSRP
ncbi:MAG TPA: glycosyltransferase family 39 protein [Gemmatimonadaceae bacterium]|nr:glycosyltransferase family 39 protein [Gemmatimonadaceae bacterium]